MPRLQRTRHGVVADLTNHLSASPESRGRTSTHVPPRPSSSSTELTLGRASVAIIKTWSISKTDASFARAAYETQPETVKPRYRSIGGS